MSILDVRGEQGFTLVEALVACAIIGVLAALAIPVFATYKADAFNTRADVDLRNVIIAEEANFDATDDYVECGPTDCNSILPGYSASDGVQLQVITLGSFFSVAACHIKGDREYHWDSQSGNFDVIDNGGICEPIPPPLS